MQNPSRFRFDICPLLGRSKFDSHCSAREKNQKRLELRVLLVTRTASIVLLRLLRGGSHDVAKIRSSSWKTVCSPSSCTRIVYQKFPSSTFAWNVPWVVLSFRMQSASRCFYPRYMDENVAVFTSATGLPVLQELEEMLWIVL